MDSFSAMNAAVVSSRPTRSRCYSKIPAVKRGRGNGDVERSGEEQSREEKRREEGKAREEGKGPTATTASLLFLSSPVPGHGISMRGTIRPHLALIPRLIAA